MSSTGVSIAYLVTCLSAYRLFGQRDTLYYNLKYKWMALLGVIVSATFLILLLFPGSPASLKLPSYIALAVWLIMGIIFFVIRFRKLKAMTKETLDHLILDKEINKSS